MACSFTGHRRIAPEHRASLPALVLRAINYAYSEGCRDFLCGGAIGFDTVAAREVLRFRMTHPDVSLHLILPCINQDAAWSVADRNSYAYLLSAADDVEYVADEYRDGCMRERNRRLAERCDILIAYCASGNSGTYQTVRMAERLGKRIYNLYNHV